jgi:hypothetical protein
VTLPSSISFLHFFHPLFLILSFSPFHTPPGTDNHSYNGAPRNAWEKATTCMVFSTPIWEFSNLFDRHHAPGVADNEAAILIDWSTDACTGVDDRPLGWDFKPSCIRHDFGYRNYKRQRRFTKVGDVLAFSFALFLCSFFSFTCISPLMFSTIVRREEREDGFADMCVL